MEFPRLRPYLGWSYAPPNSGGVVIYDVLRLSDRQHNFAWHEFLCLRLLDGKHSLTDIQARLLPEVGLLTVAWLESFVQRLEQAGLLDGPEFQRQIRQPVREPRCIGCYAGDPKALREQLQDLFAGRGGPGLPASRSPDGKLRAALLPHIDYHRGGKTYAWGFKEVFERTPASLFVIIATSHYSSHRFTLTRKDFKTPLGIVPTDQHYLDRLVAHYGDCLFDDELLAHLPEHSVELEVVFLQYLYEKVRPIRIVPLVVGSFGDCVGSQESPGQRDDIARMVLALQAVEAELDEPVCYIISGDLAHIGPKFGDAWKVDAHWLAHSRERDQLLLQAAETANPADFFRVIADEQDSRRICGLPPTWLTLAATGPSRGRVLHYDQYAHSRGHESVSFASVAFYQ